MKHGRGKWGVVSQSQQQQRALVLCSVLYWPPLTANINICHLSRRPLLDRVTLTAATLAYKFPLDNSAKSLQATKVEGVPPRGYQLTATAHPQWCHTDSTVAYSGNLAYCARLGGAFDHN